MNVKYLLKYDQFSTTVTTEILQIRSRDIINSIMRLKDS